MIGQARDSWAICPWVRMIIINVILQRRSRVEGRLAVDEDGRLADGAGPRR